MNDDERGFVSNEEYREKLKKIIDEIDENYKLRWIYLFISEKMRNDK